MPIPEKHHDPGVLSGLVGEAHKDQDRSTQRKRVRSLVERPSIPAAKNPFHFCPENAPTELCAPHPLTAPWA